MKRLCCPQAHVFLSWLIFSLLCTTAAAQFPYAETFKNKSVANFVMGGSAVLTAKLTTNADPDGDGYLRLTSPTNYQTGYAYALNSFPTKKGMTISFEFFIYKNPASSQADGISFFLFDASAPSFRAGGTGGALGYTQRVDAYTTVPGVAMGYLGIGIDEFGNFSNANDNKKNGGPGQTPGSVVIRGPGNGSSATDYVYQTGVKTSDPAYNIPFTGFNQRYPDPTQPNYRRLKIILTPGSTLGADKGFTITVILYKGGTPDPVPVTLISNRDYPFDAPARLKYGFAASTGASNNYHEIRAIDIRPTNTQDLVAPVAQPDQLTIVCQGGQGMLDVTANDQTANAGGTLNKANVDLDPTLAGTQTTFTDPNKGTYSVDSNGVVLFKAVAGFSGLSQASYTVTDDYGMVSNAAAINVTVNAGTPPDLVVSNPSAVCFPANVNITTPAVASSSTPGVVLDYFRTLTDANNATNSMAAQATSISSSGIYYVSASLGGCATVKQVTVAIDQPPTTAAAGADQVFCGLTGNLAATSPSSGTGVWTQVSGPNSAGISTPLLSSTPLTGLTTGQYIFRWSVSSGVCPASTDDIQITAYTSPTTANAGATQNLCNVSSIQLQGNTPAVGTGTWTQVGTPAATIQTPSSPTTNVTGLTAGNNYTFKWTITNGTCTASSSQVVINNSDNTVSDAGLDQVTSGTVATLAANTPAAGNTGAWSLQSAPTGSTAVVDRPADPKTTVSGLNITGDYLLRWTITNSVCGRVNFDEMKLTVSSTLPVTLVSFTGSLQGTQVLLKWLTANEAGHDHFEVERSTDGRSFSSLGKANVGTTTPGGKNYSFPDDVNQLAVPFVYYRLKQVDADGKFTYSSIVAVSLQGYKGMAISTAPNPFSSSLCLHVSSMRQEKLSWRIFDGKGMVVSAGSENVEKGENELRIANLEVLPRGVYVLEASSQSAQYREKLIKH